MFGPPLNSSSGSLMVYRHVRTLLSILNLVGARLAMAFGVFVFLFGSVAVLSGSSNGWVRGSVSTLGIGRSIRRGLDASRLDSSQSVSVAEPRRSLVQSRDVLGSRLTFAGEASRFVTVLPVIDRRFTSQFGRHTRFFPAAIPSQFSRVEPPAIAL